MGRSGVTLEPWKRTVRRAATLGATLVLLGAGDPTPPVPSEPTLTDEDQELLRNLELLVEWELLREWDPEEALPIPVSGTQRREEP